MNNSQNITDMYNEALVYSQNGHLDKALSILENIVKIRPQYSGALYAMGDVLLKLDRPLEAASSFWQSYLYMRFKKEPIIMTARSLYKARLFLEAVLVFERIDFDSLDDVSKLIYSECLRKEYSIHKSLSVLNSINDKSSNAYLKVYACVIMDLGLANEAKTILENFLFSDDNGTVVDYLFSAYTTLDEIDKIEPVLKYGYINLQKNHYLVLSDIVKYIYYGIQPNNVDKYKDEKYYMIDSAFYMKSFIEKGCQITGNSYQTFDLIRDKIPTTGLLLEFGVRNGYTITKIAEMFPERNVYGFDSFEGLPEDWNNEAKGSYSVVGRLPEVPSNVEFIVGWFNETLPEFKKNHSSPIAFINVDCDIYSSTKTIFDELDKQIVDGTVITFDEYICNKSWRDDEFKAFQEWVSKNNVKYEYLTASFYTKQVSVKILSRNNE